MMPESSAGASSLLEKRKKGMIARKTTPATKKTAGRVFSAWSSKYS
jgi:hypothetical protein